jgi:hypothetical protein
MIDGEQLPEHHDRPSGDAATAPQPYDPDELARIVKRAAAAGINPRRVVTALAVARDPPAGNSRRSRDRPTLLGMLSARRRRRPTSP